MCQQRMCSRGCLRRGAHRWICYDVVSAELLARSVVIGCPCKLVKPFWYPTSVRLLLLLLLATIPACLCTTKNELVLLKLLNRIVALTMHRPGFKWGLCSEIG